MVTCRELCLRFARKEVVREFEGAPAVADAKSALAELAQLKWRPGEVGEGRITVNIMRGTVAVCLSV